MAIKPRKDDRNTQIGQPVFTRFTVRLVANFVVVMSIKVIEVHRQSSCLNL